MKKFLLFLLPLVVLADSFILQSEEVSKWKGENKLGKVLTQLTQQLKGLKCYQ